jgi:hypothetical protein
MRKPVVFQGAKRNQLVLCKCVSQCTKQNADGEYVSRSTRDNHSRTDKLQAVVEETTSPSSRWRLPIRFKLGKSSAPRSSIHKHQADADEIRGIEAEVIWHSELPVTSDVVPLVFHNDPLSSDEYTEHTINQLLVPNIGPHSLREPSRANTAFLTTEYRLCKLASKVQAMTQSDDASTVLHRIFEELKRLDYQKKHHWNQQRARLTPHTVVVSTGMMFALINSKKLNVSVETHYSKRGPRNPILKAASLIALSMQNMFFTTRRAVKANLAGTRDLLRASKVPADVIDSLPRDPRALPSQFHLDPVTRPYLCCTSCGCLHLYIPNDRPSSDTQPTRCSFQNTPRSRVCNEPLWKLREIGEHRMVYTPIRRYLHQDLKSWVGRLLSRVGMEDLLDKYPQGAPEDPGTPVDDIWQSDVFLHLKDSTDHPFFASPNEEGRLVFGLAVDSFNPFHNKQAKQKVSSTGIWLVLLNLPPHLRYLPENMCLVGVLPGPKKPSLDEMNHSLKLVVDDLLEFWQPGVFFTRTHNYPRGRLYRGMLVPLIGDMPAVRQIIGLGSVVAHYFCTFCDLDFDDIDVLDREEWPAKSLDDVRYFSGLWKDASSELDRTKIFEAFGLRWTALLDLPYWNPILYTVIDSMHALDLGLFQHHTRELFGIDLKAVGGDGSRPLPPPLKETKEVKPDELASCRNVIKANAPDLISELLSFHRKVLYIICVDLDIRGEKNTIVVGTRWVLVKNIFHWVCHLFFSRQHSTIDLA